jgi:hypothetical protein
MLGVCTLRVPIRLVGTLLLRCLALLETALAVLFVLAVTLAWRALLVRRPLSARAPWVRLTGPVCPHAGE